MPRILDVQINWMEGFANQPRFTLLLDAAPTFGRYTKHPVDGMHLYVARDGAFATFYVWTGNPDEGFGGWSSRGQVASRVLGEELADTAYVIKRREDESLGAGTLVHVNVDTLREALARFVPGVELIEGPYAYTVRERVA